jgi:hypothetical protein
MPPWVDKFAEDFRVVKDDRTDDINDIDDWQPIDSYISPEFIGNDIIFRYMHYEPTLTVRIRGNRFNYWTNHINMFNVGGNMWQASLRRNEPILDGDEYKFYIPDPVNPGEIWNMGEWFSTLLIPTACMMKLWGLTIPKSFSPPAKIHGKP